MGVFVLMREVALAQLGMKRIGGTQSLKRQMMDKNFENMPLLLYV